MARGRSLHIGVNTVDPAHYGGWTGRLQAAEADARAMADLARGQGFDAQLLLTADATAAAVEAGIRAAAAALDHGDVFLLTYSGHGAQLPDAGGDEGRRRPGDVGPGPRDARDETWVLYDRQLLDDELYALWGHFRTGVGVVVVADCCHSGSSTRGAVAKGMPVADSEALYRAHQPSYDAIRTRAARDVDEHPEIGASVVLLAACRDAQVAFDGLPHGVFTRHLLAAWDRQPPAGSYRDLVATVAASMPRRQQPNLFAFGPDASAWCDRAPFRIGATG